MKKMNIAMVAACPFPANRGTPSRILGMAEALSELGHDIHIVTYHFGIEKEMNDFHIHRTMKMPYQYLDPGPTFTKLIVLDPLLFIKLLKVIKAHNIKLIHAHHFEGALIGYAVRKLTGIKVIYDAHTTLSSELHSYKFPQNKYLINFIDRKVPYWSDHVIAVSNTIKNYLIQQGLSPDKIDIVPTGVNLNSFSIKNPFEIRDKYNLHGRQIVMYTGSVAPFQRVDYLIEAMRRVFNIYNNVVLFFVISSDEKKIYDICVEKGINDKVKIAVEKTFDEIPAYLAAADVVVSPRVECSGMPQKLSNYMAAQKAIVCFEGSGKLITDKYDGLVVENGNTEAMADAIVKILKNRDLKESLGKNAKQTIHGKYDWISLCKKLEILYSQILR